MKYLLIALLLSLSIVVGCIGTRNSAELAISGLAAEAKEDPKGTLARLSMPETIPEHKVIYKISLAKDSKTATLGTASRYVQSKERFRGDISMQITGVSMNMRFYGLDGTNYLCYQDEKRKWACAGAQAEDAPQDMIDKYKQEALDNIDSWIVEYDGTATVARAGAVCFKILDPAESENIRTRMCLTAEGIPVQIQTIGTGEYEGAQMNIIATTYSTTVPDSDLKLPATPVMVER